MDLQQKYPLNLNCDGAINQPKQLLFYFNSILSLKFLGGQMTA